MLLEDDAAVRVQSGRALVSWALWAAQLVARDGRMNVPNERPSVESDEETFIDPHGRSLHLVGADVLHEQERPTIGCLMALLGLPVVAGTDSAVQDGRTRREETFKCLVAGRRKYPAWASGGIQICLFVDLSGALSVDGFRTSTDFAEGLLNEARVAVTPGEAFDAPGFVRISYAASMETLREGSRRLLEFVQKHQPADVRTAVN